jgi:hypothetical protein
MSAKNKCLTTLKVDSGQSSQMIDSEIFEQIISLILERYWDWEAFIAIILKLKYYKTFFSNTKSML